MGRTADDVGGSVYGEQCGEQYLFSVAGPPEPPHAVRNGVRAHARVDFLHGPPTKESPTAARSRLASPLRPHRRTPPSPFARPRRST